MHFVIIIIFIIMKVFIAQPTASRRSTSEMTYIVLGGALNSTHSLTASRSSQALQSQKME